ncbi:hypothetical protein EX30DRAFT_256353 [Ascodesmis nigricans]|uniref:Uncharacterized protein n=1 Tax=Ascodesmis nigricans TaxID=341454 RepID=A0A4S2MHV9_9PEZI|nr:hypothetical protein EX30DRAFT_256353 [Ascodesmis nigricans]
MGICEIRRGSVMYTIAFLFFCFLSFVSFCFFLSRVSDIGVCFIIIIIIIAMGVYPLPVSSLFPFFFLFSFFFFCWTHRGRRFLFLLLLLLVNIPSLQHVLFPLPVSLSSFVSPHPYSPPFSFFSSCVLDYLHTTPRTLFLFFFSVLFHFLTA